MAYDFPISPPVTHEAAEDLTADQYRFVVLTATGTVQRPNATTDVIHGVLQNAPVAGENAIVQTEGYSKIVGGEDLLIGEEVKAEFIDAADAGKGVVPAGTATHRVRGIVVVPSAAENELATIRLVDYLRVI